MTQPTLFEMDHVARAPRRRSVRARTDTVTVGSLCTGYGGLEMALAPAFVEWLMGPEPGWVTDVPGLTRNDQLRLLGNGVVRHQGAAAFRILYQRAAQ